MITKLEKFVLNEGVRDMMTPKSQEDVKDSVNRFMNDLENKSAKEIIEKLSDKKVLQYLTQEHLNKLVKTILEDKEIMEDEFTYHFENFMTCISARGSGRIIINLQNNKIYSVGLFAANEVINALRQLL